MTKYELRLDFQHRTKAELHLGLLISFVRLRMTSYETSYLRYEVKLRLLSLCVLTRI